MPGGRKTAAGTGACRARDCVQAGRLDRRPPLPSPFPESIDADNTTANQGSSRAQSSSNRLAGGPVTPLIAAWGGEGKQKRGGLAGRPIRKLALCQLAQRRLIG